MSAQGQPGRYNRSFGGMTGALIVTVLFVLAFVTWRGLFRGEVDDTPVPVDWRDIVQVAEQANLSVVHPAGDDPRWGLGVLTDDGDFVGIRQQDASVDDLVELYVDEDADAGDEASVTSEVADTWQTFTDDGGDTGYATEIGDEALLVYGSAPAGDIEAFMGLLTR